MADEGFKRKPTAILSADAAGYSRTVNPDQSVYLAFMREFQMPLFACATLFFVFFVAYCTSGFILLPTFETHIEFLGGDHLEWINQGWERWHKGSHPLLILFLKPFEAMVSVLPKLRGPVFAVFLNAAFGALAVVLSFICFWNFNRRLTQSVIVATLYGCTTGQVFFGGIPESRMIEASVIIGSYALLAASLNAVKVRFLLWVAAGLLTFGVTVTHFFHTLSAFIGKSFYLREHKPFSLIVKYSVVILTSAVVLAFLQRGIVPRSKLFFHRQTVDFELQYSVLDSKREFKSHKVVKNLIKQFALYNIVAPEPVITCKSKTDKWTRCKLVKNNFSVLGAIGVLLWLSLTVFGVIRNSYSFFRDRKRRTTLLVTTAAIAFNLVLHSLYGNHELYLYQCSFTFPILLFVIDPNFKSRLYSCLLVVLTGIACINNFPIVWSIANSAS